MQLSQTRVAAQPNTGEGRVPSGLQTDAGPVALQSGDQLQLLQLLMKKQQHQESLRQQQQQQQQENFRQQQAVPQQNQQQQQQHQVLLQLMLQSQNAAAQSSHAVGIQSQQQFVRPRAIKSQQPIQAQPALPDLGMQQQRDAKVDQAAKLTEFL
jgi:hypothetical protein